MSKTMKTEDRIVAKALELFNERGIEYVGLREIAAVLDMRVSNITYYFPTKDDLVFRLSSDLSKLNAKVVVANEDPDPGKFVLNFEKVFRNHLQYRCLLLSFVHLMEQNRKIAARYRKTRLDRNAALRSNLEALEKAEFLRFGSVPDIEFLVSAIAIIVRFWISEAAVSLKHLDPEKQISHYLSMIGRLLLPYCTAKGKKQILKVLKRLA